MAETSAKTWRVEFELSPGAHEGDPQERHRRPWNMRAISSGPGGASVGPIEETADDVLDLIPKAVEAVADLLVQCQRAVDQQQG
ncbi:hypothetical protein BH20ACT1_BH20ACT1_04240 [soil metagenome]